MRPKLWDGADAVGEAKARFNEQLGTPFTTASGPGFTARKMGEFSEVTRPPVETKSTKERFFSLGQYSKDGVVNRSFIVGSPELRARFYGTGSTTWTGYEQVALTYLGGGTGVFARDWVNGYTATPADDKFYTTYVSVKKGRRFKAEITVIESPWPWSSFRGLYQYITPQIVQGACDGGVSRNLTWGLSANVKDEAGKYLGVYIYTLDGEWAYSQPLRYPEFNSSAPYIARLGPTTLIAFTPVYRTATPVVISSAGPVISDYNPDNVPLPFFSKSLDNGVTWSYFPASGIFDDFIDEYSADGYNAAVNELVKEGCIAAVSPTSAVGVFSFLKHVAYTVDGVAGTHEKERGFDYLEGERRYDLVAGYDSYRKHGTSEFRVWGFSETAVTHIATLDSARVNPLTGEVVQLLPGDGVLVAQWAPVALALTSHVLAISTDEGATWLYRDLPWAAYQTGLVSWLDTDTLLCCANQDGFCVYASTDLGVTWKRRAKLNRTTLPAPVLPPGGWVPTAHNCLRAFGAVCQFLDGDKNANASPSAKWICDALEDYQAPT